MTLTNSDPVFYIEQGDYESPIGAKSDNVYIVSNGVIICNLTDFYREWAAFRDTAKFLQYGTTAPTSLQVKLWYETEMDEAEDTSYSTGDNTDADAPSGNDAYAENEILPQENNG